MPKINHATEPPFYSFPVVKTAVFNDLTQSGLPPAKCLSIAAPTGYGKTVLLGALHSHYQKAGADCRWVALDDRDDNVGRVLGYLEALLGQSGAEYNVLQVLHRGDEPTEERVANILQALALLEKPIVIFLDNLNYCADPALETVLNSLIFRTPSWVYIVLSSTVRIPADHSRAKLEGSLRQIGISELSFGGEEIKALLGAELCKKLAPGASDAISTQTEGWAAAVRLMQIILSATDRPDEALKQFSGADEDLAALLNRQVLQGFNPELRKFLLEISLLRTFGADLCKQVTGDERARDHLDALLKNNVFMVPLDRNRSLYRLHALFREFLIDEARRQLPAARTKEILSKAAEWCEQEGSWQDAVEYALASDYSPLAVSILERVASMFVRDRGDLRQYIEWVELLHSRGAQCGLNADYWYVWALVFHRQYEYARQQLERLLSRHTPEDVSSEESTEFWRRCEVIRIAIDVYTDRTADAHRSCMSWLEEARNDDPFNSATVACAAGIHMTAINDLVEARRLTRLAQSHIAQSNSDYGFGWVMTLSAMIGLREGDYPRAYQDLLAALSRAKLSLGEHSGMVGTISLLAAKSAVEMNLETEALDLLKAGLRKARYHGITDTAAFGLDAAVKLWKATPQESRHLAELEDIVSAYPPRLALMFACFKARRLIRLGKVEEAVVQAGYIGISTESGSRKADATDKNTIESLRGLIAATEIDLYISAGKLKQALTMVEREKEVALSQGLVARSVELTIDEAAISHCTHNPTHTLRHMTRAVRLAAKNRHLRPFKDRTEMVAQIVNETKPKKWGFVLEEERQFFAEICRDLPIANSALLEYMEELNIESRLTDTPTARELELLTLMDAGLSNQQLADRTSVSISTVKWHLYNLYTKLGVSSRSAALSRARALNLLTR